MNLIQNSIDAAVRGELQLERGPNFCLKAVRQVVEHANGWPSGELYTRMKIWAHFTATNRQQAPGTPWARSMEQAFVEQGRTVKTGDVRPGDVVFSRVPATYGHVGVVGLGPDGQPWVLENATVRRGQSLGGSLNWVPLAKWGGLTTVGRLPDEWVFSPGAPVVVPRPETPPTPGAGRTRVLMPDGKGGYVNVAGQRLEVPATAKVLVVNNALNPNDVWIDWRKE